MFSGIQFYFPFLFPHCPGLVSVCHSREYYVFWYSILFSFSFPHCPGLVSVCLSREYCVFWYFNFGSFDISVR
jgi:hypothetical protein